MALKRKILTLFTGAFLFLFMSIGVGCVSSLDTYQGKTADQNSRIALRGGSHSGVWQTDDVMVNYTYVREPNNLQISGYVELKQKVKDASDIVQHFYVQVVFLNAAGRGLNTKELVIAGDLEPITKWDFNHNFEILAGTSGMAFTYDGQMAADLGGNAAMEFWHDPFQ